MRVFLLNPNVWEMFFGPSCLLFSSFIFHVILHSFGLSVLLILVLFNSCYGLSLIVVVLNLVYNTRIISQFLCFNKSFIWCILCVVQSWSSICVLLWKTLTLFELLPLSSFINLFTIDLIKSCSFEISNLLFYVFSFTICSNLLMVVV